MMSKDQVLPLLEQAQAEHLESLGRYYAAGPAATKERDEAVAAFTRVRFFEDLAASYERGERK